MLVLLPKIVDFNKLKAKVSRIIQRRKRMKKENQSEEFLKTSDQKLQRIPKTEK